MLILSFISHQNFSSILASINLILSLYPHIITTILFTLIFTSHYFIVLMFISSFISHQNFPSILVSIILILSLFLHIIINVFFPLI